MIDLYSSTDIPELYKSRAHWEEQFRRLKLWPKMLSYDRIYQSFSAQIDEFFPEFQLTAVSKSEPRVVVGIAHSVPLSIGENEVLPETGWDFALETAMVQYKAKIPANSLCGLSITVMRNFQRWGAGTQLILGLLRLARRMHLQRVVMPVRPVLKETCPLTPMHEFLAWRRADGYHNDPWIRAHEKVGGEILNVCSQSMTVKAPCAQWERWAGHRFARSGQYIVQGCLEPVTIDIDSNVGLYMEPNVWMAHSPL